MTLRDKNSNRLLPLLLGLMFWSHPLLAEPKGQDAALKEVLRKAQGVMRQLNEDKIRLEAEKTTLQGEKTALEHRLGLLTEKLLKLETLPATLERCESRVSTLEDVKTGLNTQLGQFREHEARLKREQQALNERTRLLTADNQWLVEAVREREQWIERCGENNRNLVKSSQQLAEKYRDQGFWKRMLEQEPLTGIGSVQTENAAEAYRYQMHRLKVTPYTPTASGRPVDGEIQP